MKRRLYFDWNATAPIHDDVRAAMIRAWDDAWANPASVHEHGRSARANVDAAREAVAALTGHNARDVVITSGGTEANNMALAHAFSRGKGALIVSRIEHPSIVRAAEALADRGVAVVWIDPEPSGRADPEALKRALDRSDVALVTLQAVNHETGVIQPVAEVAAIAKERGIPLHVDAIQAAGKLDQRAWRGADLVSIAAHKIRGPKGIGALVTRPGLKLRPVLFGGAQERGLRPGTQDPAAAAGFSIAARRACGTAPGWANVAPLRDALEADLVSLGQSLGIEVLVNGTSPRAPHVSNLSWMGLSGAELAASLDLEGLSVSSGSACAAGTAEPSPVITAMGGRARAASALRISLGEDTAPDDVAHALAIFERVLARMKRAMR